MIMKIGILTQPLEDNYGGILQNWALQQVLKDLGHDPITLDYGLKYDWGRFILSCGKSVLYKLTGRDRHFPHPPRHGRYGSKYSSEFIYKYINKTKPVKKLSERLLEVYNIDTIIVGSDQVWRPSYNEKIENSYLEFAPNFRGRRIAYGVSFGVDEWEYSETQTKSCSVLAKRFDSISVREVSGVKLCKENLNVSAVQVLDPTLLLSDSRYKTLCNKVDVKENFVAVYCIDLTEGKLNLIKNIASKSGLPIKIFSANRGAELTVEQWLAMFRDASYIITDSFHGTIFSIIFKKPFYTIANEARGTSRFESLLSSIGLYSRLCPEVLYDEIDWTLIDNKLCEFQNKSIQFINASLKS